MIIILASHCEAKCGDSDSPNPKGFGLEPNYKKHAAPLGSV